MRVCVCVCRRWGAVICKCNSDGEISSRCATAARKVSAAVIRIPLSREEEQPAVLHRECERCARPRRSPTPVPNGAYFNCCTKKKFDSRSRGTGVSPNTLAWLRRLASRERPHSHSARDVVGLIYWARYSVWLQMHPGTRPGCRMINLEDLGCVHPGSMENMNEADPSDGVAGEGAAWEQVGRRRGVRIWLGFVSRALSCSHHGRRLPAWSACHIRAAAMGLAHWGPVGHRTTERKAPSPPPPCHQSNRWATCATRAPFRSATASCVHFTTWFVMRGIGRGL